MSIPMEQLNPIVSFDLVAVRLGVIGGSAIVAPKPLHSGPFL
jgi:hypothetical protein